MTISKRQKNVLWYLQVGFTLTSDPLFTKVEAIGSTWSFKVSRCILQRLIKNELIKNQGEVRPGEGIVYLLTDLGKTTKVVPPSETEMMKMKNL